MKYTNVDKEIEVGDQVMYERKVTNVMSLKHYFDNCCPDVLLGNGLFLAHGAQFNNLEYILNTPTPHIHKDIIIAWANGFDIEYYGKGDVWDYISKPNFYYDKKYRIKPIINKSPAQLEKEAIKEEMDKLSERLEELDVE